MKKKIRSLDQGSFFYCRTQLTLVALKLKIGKDEKSIQNPILKYRCIACSGELQEKRNGGNGSHRQLCSGTLH